MRTFAALPDHIKLEMPNLSPTMEKVSARLNHFILLRETLETGKLKEEISFLQEMLFAELKQIRPLLIMKCRKRGMSLLFCIQLVLRMSL